MVKQISLQLHDKIEFKINVFCFIAFLFHRIKQAFLSKILYMVAFYVS